MARIQDIDIPYLEFAEAAAPGTPASGIVRIYAKTDGSLYQKDDGGTETGLAGGDGGSGALVFLAAQTASASASLAFTTFISSTYDTYLIEGVELILATNGANLLLEVGTGAGPTYDTGANYEWAAKARATDGTDVNDSGSGAGCRVFSAIANAAGYGFGSFSIIATGLQSTAIRKTFQGTQQYVNTTPRSVIGTWGAQWTTSGTAATAVRFIPSSGNITSGTIRIYGMVKS